MFRGESVSMGIRRVIPPLWGGRENLRKTHPFSGGTAGDAHPLLSNYAEREAISHIGFLGAWSESAGSESSDSLGGDLMPSFAERLTHRAVENLPTLPCGIR